MVRLKKKASVTAAQSGLANPALAVYADQEVSTTNVSSEVTVA